MANRQQELDRLQLAVAQALEPLGRVSLASPSKGLRRVTVIQASGAAVRVIISGEFRSRTCAVSVLRIVDDHNPKLTYSPNHTFRGMRSHDPDLGPIVCCVIEALEALAQVPQPQLP